MKEVVFQSGRGEKWIDLVNPTPEELQSAGEEFGISLPSLKHCLEPTHLPKYEDIGTHTFIILRLADLKTYMDPEADTVRELTRKVAFYYSKDLLLTVHSKEIEFLGPIKQRAQAHSSAGWPDLILHSVLDLAQEVFRSYAEPIRWVEQRFEELEELLLARLSDAKVIESVYFLKRKVSVLRRVLSQAFEVFLSLKTWAGKDPHMQDVREIGERQIFFANELEQDAEHLLNTYLSLSAHRTNEIVRVLTLFSVFFMPLTFIVGVYGMNFQFMPELESRLGYPLVWAVMLILSLGLFFWFRRKGWLR